jgi:hypothetical protein
VVWVDLLLEVGEEGSSGVGGELTAVVAGMDGEAADTAAECGCALGRSR